MESLAYFLLWGGVLYLLLRFRPGTQIVGDDHGQEGTPVKSLDRSPKQLGWAAPRTAFDPVCGKTVQTNTAKSSVDDGTVHFFCSRDCRERFEAAPNLYLGQPLETPPKEMSHGHG